MHGAIRLVAERRVESCRDLCANVAGEEQRDARTRLDNSSCRRSWWMRYGGFTLSVVGVKGSLGMRRG